MSNTKLLMFAVAGLVVPAAYDGVANAEVHGSVSTIMVPHPTKDLAPVTGNPPRLRRTQNNEPGAEMATFALFGDGVHGLYFAMSTELNGVRANHRVQLSMTPFTLTQDPATGSVSAVADTAKASFITDNDGNDRRNCNQPTALAVNGGNVICVEYNYQKAGTNDTVRYEQCFNQAGAKLLDQTKVFAKNNDDASTNQDGQSGSVVSFDKATATTKLASWRGANGNGSDNGWFQASTLKCNSADAPTSCQFASVFDVALEQQEERTMGTCSVDAADTSYAVCTWTAGNTQPCRNGVWIGAVALDTGATGADQKQTILWKKQIAGRIDNPDGVRTYAQRAIHERVVAADPTTGALVPSNKLLFTYGDATGNNTNDRKGGTYRTRKLALIQVSRQGPTFITPPVDMAPQLLGLGGTHLASTAAVFGTDDHLVPGLVLLNGSHNGGGINAEIRSIGLDASNKFTNLGTTVTAPHDRHMYPNYLGGNPGVQGRNKTTLLTVPNPFVGQASNTDKYLLLSATTAKTMATSCIGCDDSVSDPKIKLTAMMTVTGIAQKAGSGTGGGNGMGGGNGGGGTGSGSNGSDSGSNDPGTTLGGCSAGGGSAGLATFLLIGLAAFARRRR